jgi:diguanylate cyclase (GGDEF)-like protein
MPRSTGSKRVDADRLPQLTDELDDYLALPWYRVFLPPALERRFIATTAHSRCSQIRFGLLGVAALHLVFLIPDSIQGHHMLMLGLWLRVCISLPILIAGACLLRGGMPGWAEGVLGGFPIVIAFACDVQLARHASEIFRDRYFMSAGTQLCIGTSLIPFRRAYAIACMACYLLILDTTLLGTFGPVSFPHPTQLALLASVMVVIYAVFRWRAEAQDRRSFLISERDRIHTKQLAWANHQLTVLSYTDPLTGLANRRFFDDALLRLWNEAMNSNLPLSILMIDIDHFKAYNDSMGHSAGDKCLRRVAQAMQFCVRADKDSLARCGGEEFIAVIPGASLDDAEQIAERIRIAVEDLKIAHPLNPLSKSVTVCVGVATAEDLSAGEKPDMLVRAADFALYTAKSRGRNCIVSQELSGKTKHGSLETASAVSLA